MNFRELAITQLGTALGELLVYFTVPSDEPGYEDACPVFAGDIEHGRWPGSGSAEHNELAAEIFREALLDGALVDEECQQDLFDVLGKAAELVECYARATA